MAGDTPAIAITIAGGSRAAGGKRDLCRAGGTCFPKAASPFARQENRPLGHVSIDKLVERATRRRLSSNNYSNRSPCGDTCQGRRLKDHGERGYRYEMKETLRWYREWIYGLLLSVGRTVRALMHGKSPAMRGITKKCAYCKEFLRVEARVCAFCGAIL